MNRITAQKARFSALIIALSTLLSATGCLPFNVRTPSGFARLSDPRPSYDYRAVSAYGVAMGVRAIPNRDGGNLAFWSEAVDRRLQSSGFYHVIGQDDTRTERGLVGKTLRYSAGDPQSGGTYWVTLFVTRDWVYFVESGGRAPAFARAQPEVERAIRSFEGS
jgi:hypothetical protein